MADQNLSDDDDELLRLIEQQEERMAGKSERQRRRSGDEANGDDAADLDERDLDDAAGLDYGRLYRTRVMQPQHQQSESRVAPVANVIQKQSVMLPQLRPGPQATLWAYEQMRAVVDGEKILNWKNTLEVVWIRALQVGRVQSPKGNILQSMGRAVDRQHYLLAEECLFLLERGSILLYAVDDDAGAPTNGCVPLSVQEAYEQLLGGGDLRWVDYVAYGHLRRNGYLVTRSGWAFKRLPAVAEQALRAKTTTKQQTEIITPHEVPGTDIEQEVATEPPPCQQRYPDALRIRRTAHHPEMSALSHRRPIFDVFRPGMKKSQTYDGVPFARLFVLGESEPFLTAEEVASHNDDAKVFCAVVAVRGASITMVACGRGDIRAIDQSE